LNQAKKPSNLDLSEISAVENLNEQLNEYEVALKKLDKNAYKAIYV